jgi:hypothetical protein
MDMPSQEFGSGHIFCLGDSFDVILRELSPNYFAACHRRLRSLLKQFRIDVDFDVGWMHPGYAAYTCDAPPSLDDPGALFGWITKSRKADFYKDESMCRRILAAGAIEQPTISWATCSARLYEFKNLNSADYESITRVYCDFAVDEPSDWAGAVVIRERMLPIEPWRRLCFAVATNDPKLEQQAWEEARRAYTPQAICLLRRGIAWTQECPKMT